MVDGQRRGPGSPFPRSHVRHPQGKPADRYRHESGIYQPPRGVESRGQEPGRHEDRVGADDRLRQRACGPRVRLQGGESRRPGHGHYLWVAKRQAAGLHAPDHAGRQALVRVRSELTAGREGGTIMAFRPGRVAFAVALGTALTLAVPMTASAQGRGGGPPLYTPTAADKDAKAVLYNWASHMGMLRGVEEHELAVSLEYQGNGTIQVDGQPCTLKKYRVSTNYQTAGQRTQIECTRSNGQTYSNVEVVSGAYAWNEDIPGAEIIADKGKATPMPAMLQERLVRLWAGPQGAVKAAIAGAGIGLMAMDRDLGRILQAGTTTIGQTSVAWEGNKPIVTYPIPGVAGATAKATLDSRYMAARVVVTNGTATTEFVYSDYQDWNNPLNRIEAYYAG